MVYRSLNNFTGSLSINRVDKRKRIITRSESQPNYAYSDQTFEDVNTMLVKYFTFRSDDFVAYVLGGYFSLPYTLNRVLEFSL